MVAVTINGPATVTGPYVEQGITLYAWTFGVTVNGQAGLYTVWSETDDQSFAPTAELYAQQDLALNPGSLEGIAQTDGTGRDGVGPDGPDGPDGDDGDDEGDGVLAGNGDGDGFGDSV